MNHVEATNYANPKSLGSRFRQRRSIRLRKMIEKTYREHNSCSIIDVGGTPAYWAILDPAFLRLHKVSITLVNIDPQPNPDPELFRIVTADGCNLPFDTDQFDIAHSNSVIEHLPAWHNVQTFAQEVQRVARQYFVQTPAFCFPIEPHFGTPFFHWLPEPVRVRRLMKKAHGTYPRLSDIAAATSFVQEIRLMNRHQFASLFPDGTIHAEKFLGLTKSYMAVKGA